MWGAQIDNRGQEDMETYLQRLVLLASNKIIGGKVPTLEEIDHTSALAILAICICLHVSPLAQRLVASHMCAICSGMVEAGYHGELAARIILIRAWDVCACIHNHRTITNQYSSPITIAEFINALFGIDLVQFVMQQKHYTITC
ncbi:9027_t:CDS:2 [Paraglomus brasilianum]|uniref:9027_t:CDS:1 n=1 Tax=Paraglomus brasilianum TaxID=144538 RepID=A0A9N9GYJ7_9GLOM|nr:9027_t:CDS:2 [Paraglomus brasilianum]